MEKEKCPGHKRREELIKKIRRARENRGKDIDSSKKICVSLGAGVEEDMNLCDLEERKSRTPEWMEVAKGGLRVIPVTEFTLNSLPKPKKGVVDFLTTRKNERVIEGYSMPRSEEVLEKELVHKFGEFKIKGETDEVAKTSVFKTLKKKHEALQKWRNTKAEIVMKEAAEKVVRDLKIPSVVVRSVDYKYKEHHYLKELGLTMPDKDLEIDLLIAYVAGNYLHIILCEVKRPETEPWADCEREPTKESIDTALKQLDTDIDWVLGLLPDVPGSSLNISAITCFPDTPRSILEKMFCKTCMEMILSKEDLEDASILTEKFMIQTQPGAKRNDEALENLLKLYTRLVGLHSVLHIGWRDMRDVGMLETNRMNTNIKKVEKGKYVLASQQQQEVIAVARGESEARHVTIRGAPGSGKTVVLLGLLREFAKQPGKRLIVVSAMAPEQSALASNYKVMEHLDNATKDIKCERIFSYWDRLLINNKINEASYQIDSIPSIDGEAYPIKNHPAMINDLATALSKRFPEHQILLAIDEVVHYNITTRQMDWTKLHVPETVSLALAFNITVINRYGDTRLPCDPSFLNVSCGQIFRSTQSITEFMDFVMDKMEKLNIPGKTATDVKGELPSIVDLGYVKNLTHLHDTLLHLKKMLDQEGRREVVLIYDIYTTSEAQKSMIKFAKEAGWEASVHYEFFGVEADTVIYIGVGILEAFTRAKVRLCIVHMFDVEIGCVPYKGVKFVLREAHSKGLVNVLKFPDIPDSDLEAEEASSRRPLPPEYFRSKTFAFPPIPEIIAFPPIPGPARTNLTTALIDCLTDLGGGKPATDVIGELPSFVDLGEVTNLTWLRETLYHIKVKLELERRREVVLMYDPFLTDCSSLISDQTKRLLHNMADELKWDALMFNELIGEEADTIVYVGSGLLEAFRRAKVRLCIVLMFNQQVGRNPYVEYKPLFREAHKKGLINILKPKNTWMHIW